MEHLYAIPKSRDITKSQWKAFSRDLRIFYKEKRAEIDKVITNHFLYGQMDSPRLMITSPKIFKQAQ